tara:strand:- start:75 stop:308 length:234 start_codon:yes stop_codon:yes gene_type:complete
MTFNTKPQNTKYDERHGGPFDRGSADSWYRRAPNPHYWTRGSYQGEQVLENEMTEKEIEAYYAGFDENERAGAFKEY